MKKITVNRIRSAIRIPISTLLNHIGFLFDGVSCGKNFISNGNIIISNSDGKILIGNNVRINSHLLADPIGGQTKTILFTKGNGVIDIKDNVGMSNVAICAQNSITINEYAAIGAGVKSYDTNFHSINDGDRLFKGDNNIVSKPVVIGSRSFIGAQTIILKGVTIGEGAVIGAGSVVTKDVPPNEIWAGNPAHFIRQVD